MGGASVAYSFNFGHQPPFLTEGRFSSLTND